MTNATSSTARRCGYVAVLGAPNAGKSTLVNRLTGAKVSIVTPKPQTTRSRIIGVRTDGDAQIVFVDTPGIFAPRRRLDRAMVAAAWAGASDADVIVLVVDASRRENEETTHIAERLKSRTQPMILVLNKIDLVKRETLLARAKTLNEVAPFVETFMISARKGNGVDDLDRGIRNRIPEGPWLFPEDQLSQLNERLFAAEITREQLFIALYQEVPYALAVDTDVWEGKTDGSVVVRQSILVGRDSQRAIVLGKGGARIKAMGTAARLELEKALDRRVHLFLDVVVRENWAEERDRYATLGLDFDS